MATTDPSCTLLQCYSEQNPFTLIPQPYNLVPIPPDDSHDTQEFRKAARDQESHTGYNPLADSYGSCPLIIHDPNVRDIECHAIHQVRETQR